MILYTLNCPKCNVIEAKLKEKNIEYTKVEDIALMENIGVQSIPTLSINGKLYSFAESIKYIKDYI